MAGLPNEGSGRKTWKDNCPMFLAIQVREAASVLYPGLSDEIDGRFFLKEELLPIASP